MQPANATLRHFSVALNVSWGLRTIGWPDIMFGGAFLALQASGPIFCYCGALFATSSRPLGLRSRLMTSGLADGASDGDLYLASEVQSNVANAREPCSH